MDLSPNDIRNYGFNTQMRGYSREEVDNFREQVAVVMEALKQQNLLLTQQLESVKTQLSGIRQFEETIKSAAIDARRNADMTIANAKKEAEEIVARAQKESEPAFTSRANQIAELEERYSKLQHARTSYLARLRSLIKSHLQVLDEASEAEPMPPIETAEAEPAPAPESEAEAGLEITESSDVTRRRRETIASGPMREQSIKTEEANAPTKIVEASPPVDAGDTGRIPTVGQPPADEQDSSIDPDLANALKQYQQAAPQTATQPQAPSPPPTPETAPAAGPPAPPPTPELPPVQPPVPPKPEAAPVQPPAPPTPELPPVRPPAPPKSESAPSEQPVQWPAPPTPEPPPVQPPPPPASESASVQPAEHSPLPGLIPPFPTSRDTDKTKPVNQQQAQQILQPPPGAGTTESKPPGPTMAADELAAELDEVVAKFEEEMDKAEKS